MRSHVDDRPRMFRHCPDTGTSHLDDRPRTFRPCPDTGTNLRSHGEGLAFERRNINRNESAEPACGLESRAPRTVVGRETVSERRDGVSPASHNVAERGQNAPLESAEGILSKVRRVEVIILSDTDSASTVEAPLSSLPPRGSTRRSRRNFQPSSRLSPDLPGYLPRAARKNAPRPRRFCEEGGQGGAARDSQSEGASNVDTTELVTSPVPPDCVASDRPVESPSDVIIADPSTSRESSPSSGFAFTAASPSRPTEASPPPTIEASPAPEPPHGNLDCSDTPSSSGSLKSPTPPTSVTSVERAESAWGNPFPRGRDGEAPTAAVPASPLPGHEALPMNAETAPAPESLEEIDVRTAPFVGERVIENVTFSDDEMAVLHRFLGKVMPTPEAGFGSTAPDLARHLSEFLGDHVATLVRERLDHHGFDPDRP